MPFSSERLQEVFNLVEQHVETRYGIPVRVTDVPHPFTGDLDGAEIQIDHDQGLEDALFILVHLFGHTVQWNVCEDARELGLADQENPSDEELEQIREYEVQACGYSMQLFHELGIDDFDQWLSDFAACDYAYLEHFYRTGEKKPFRDFWRDGTPCIGPRPIPEFAPTRWRTRWGGVVV